MTEQPNIKALDEIHGSLQKVLEKEGFYSAVESAKKTLKMMPYDFRIQLFMADTLYKWGEDLEKKNDLMSKEKFQQAHDLYFDIFQRNPNFAQFNNVSSKKRLCIKKLYG
jgi:hypothetical protein